MTGTCAIFWYIYWHQLDWAEKAGNHHHVSTNHRHHHQHRRSQNQSSSHRHNRHPRRQLSHESENAKTVEEFPGRERYHGNLVDGGSYYDRSASSGDEYKDLQWDTRPPNYHRHRSASHSGAQSMLIGDCSLPSNCYTYSKMYPCKKHGTIPPRYSSNYRHHLGPLLTHPNTLNAYSPECQQICPVNSKCHKCNHTHFCSSIYDDDLLVDLDLPLPPPPPIPRDVTCTTTVSGDDFFLDHPASANAATNTPNSQKDRNTLRDHRKTTPV
ncbi:unnamed protein product [Allacma fusca]|uniref:Uncharacterized protein n=1 Tax=Allacma fusca TaxID=39272 RepID=A0A8J2PB75_9HEXA|nr:unnamed protein product [Allacma fusca]